MIKVLHIIQGYGGGISSLVRNLIVASDKSLIQQDVMSFIYENADDFIKCMDDNSAKVFLMPRPRVEGYKNFKNYVLKVLRDGNYDVVHCHSDGWRSTVFRRLSKKAGVKIFCVHAHRTSNNPGFIQNNFLYLKINRYISSRNADIKFACGEEASEFIYGKCEHVTIPNGIDLDKCSHALRLYRNTIRENLNVLPDEILVFHAGRFVVQKNHDFIIRIAESLRDAGVKFKMLLAGTGDLENQVKTLISDKGLQNYVYLLGRRDDVYKLIYAADCMILPSTSEGLPTVVMESQIMSTPCCVSDKVTSECDFNLGLVNFIPIDSVKPWISAISDIKNIEKPTREEIEETFKKNAYTSKGAAQRYYSTLKSKIDSTDI